MLAICEQFASEFDWKLNSSKSLVTKTGIRHNVQCAPFFYEASQLFLLMEFAQNRREKNWGHHLYYHIVIHTFIGPVI